MKKITVPILLAALLSLLVPLAGAVCFGGYAPLNPSANAAVAPAEDLGSISINAVGDIMLSRKVETWINNNGLDYPVRKVADFLADADVTFANLESPLSDQGTKLPGKGIWFRGNPQNVETLVMAGVDLVTLANNHMMDYDEQALLQTIEVLDEANIANIGAGADITSATAPYMQEINGVKIAWLAYSEMADLYFSVSYPRRLQASADEPGISPYVENAVIEDIEAVRDQADVVILTLHWGVEYNYTPEAYQQMAARKYIDAGADIILGHHPHCIQGVETYNGGLIVYSMGNFIFDQEWSQQTMEGVALKLEVSPLGWKSARIYPVLITAGQPDIVSGEEGTSIMERMIDISATFGTQFQQDPDSLLVVAP